MRERSVRPHWVDRYLRNRYRTSPRDTFPMCDSFQPRPLRLAFPRPHHCVSHSWNPSRSYVASTTTPPLLTSRKRYKEGVLLLHPTQFSLPIRRIYDPDRPPYIPRPASHQKITDTPPHLNVNMGPCSCNSCGCSDCSSCGCSSCGVRAGVYVLSSSD